ncbi:PREDICTED: transmembrane emp24 domain-containing protein 6-like [Branchiostoma belcheri]|uniref:Transmembrane emp24 domain-containing protein 6-like n=1 Tax=Branchiostoma belcheri TaxID=7741 RepID=A0A6P4ZLS9_BRABE|nr:PREDICTED: transmembrane emp24 domain-containing protein 6-like [Branchiostoma belcheri]
MAGTRAVLLLFLLLGCKADDTDPGTREDEWDPDTMPGTNFDFTVHIAPRTEECFYQYARVGARMAIQYHVINTGIGVASKDRTITLRVVGPRGKPLKREFLKEEGEDDYVIEKAGAYQICLSNGHSRYISKMVYLFVSVSYKEDWDQYSQVLAENVESMQSLGNLTHTMAMVRNRVNYMLSFQNYNRWHFAKDFRMAKISNFYVQFWSILQCVVIIGCAFFQVYFVKKLFNVKTLTPTNKPRC